MHPIPPMMFNPMRPALSLPSLLNNHLLRFGSSHPMLTPSGLAYPPMVNPITMFPKINASLLNPLANIHSLTPTTTVEQPSAQASPPPSLSPSGSPLPEPIRQIRKRTRSSSDDDEPEHSVTPAKRSRIIKEEPTPSESPASSSSSDLTAADISANKSDENSDEKTPNDEIKVYRNGKEIEIAKCDICKCIFLDKVTSIDTLNHALTCTSANILNPYGRSCSTDNVKVLFNCTKCIKIKEQPSVA